MWLLDHADILGGGQLFALRLARILRESREIVVVCPRSSELDDRLRSEGIETRHAVFPAPVPGPRQVRAALALRKLLRDAPDDAILVGNSARTQAFTALALAGRRRKSAFVHLMHERDSAERRSARAVYSRFGALAVIGSTAAQTYRARLPATHVEALNTFLDPRDLDAMVAARGPPPAGESPVVGFLGRLIPEKGALELVEELGGVRARIAGARQD